MHSVPGAKHHGYRVSEAFSSGRADLAQRIRETETDADADAEKLLNELGLAEADLVRFADEWDAHAPVDPETGEKLSIVPGTQHWEDADAAELFRTALDKSRDFNLIMGSPLDRPRLPGVPEEVSRTVFQFMNFAFAANTRILNRGLQNRDSAVLSGVMLATGLGMLSIWAKHQARGAEAPEPEDWIVQGIGQSGASGLIFDVDRYVTMASQGRVGITPLTGLDAGPRFFSSQAMLAEILGPVSSLGFGAGNLALDAADLDVTEGEAGQLKRLIPMNNLFYLRRLFDAAADAGE